MTLTEALAAALSEAIVKRVDDDIMRILGQTPPTIPAPVTPDFYAEPCPQCHATGAHANGCELGDLP